MSNNSLITEIVKKINARFSPQKIIVFGSYAWGNPTEVSHIDLFLIMDSKLRRDERARQVQKIFPDRTFPLDIIVYTPHEVKKSLERGNPFIKEILEKGISYA